VIRRRMEAVTRAERRGGSSLGLKLLRDEMLSSVPLFHQWMTRWTWFARCKIFLTQATNRSSASPYAMHFSI
jgi:hypothetical protein